MRYISSKLDSRSVSSSSTPPWFGWFTNPAPLEVQVYGFNMTYNASRIISVGKPTYNTNMKLSPRKPFIVFIPSRKQTRFTAINLLTYAASDRLLHVEPEDIATFLDKIRNKTLRGMLFRYVLFNLYLNKQPMFCCLFQQNCFFNRWMLLFPPTVSWWPTPLVEDTNSSLGSTCSST